MSAFDTPDAAAFCPECQRERLNCVHMDDDREPRADGGIPQPDDLTRFQIDILSVLGDGPRHGLAIIDVIEAHAGAAITQSRLYRNLDELVAMGLVDKRRRDGRTNEYALTAAGGRVLERRRDWLAPDTTDEERRFWCEHCGHGPLTSAALLRHHGKAHPDREPALVEYDPTADAAVADGGEVSADG